VSEFEVPPYECGDGWKKIIDPLVEFCRQNNIQISQIKQKYGELRFYTDSHYSPELQNLIDAANLACIDTCEECGEPGVTRETHGGWVYVSCEQHIRE